MTPLGRRAASRGTLSSCSLRQAKMTPRNAYGVVVFRNGASERRLQPQYCQPGRASSCRRVIYSTYCKKRPPQIYPTTSTTSSASSEAHSSLSSSWGIFHLHTPYALPHLPPAHSNLLLPALIVMSNQPPMHTCATQGQPSPPGCP